MQMSSKNVSRKGQLSFEGLAIYLIAAITIILILGSLSYFDLLHFSKYLPEKCSFGANIQCVEHFLKKTDSTFNLTLFLQNNMNKGIVPIQVNLYDNSGKEIICNTNLGLKIYCPMYNNDFSWSETPSNELIISEYNTEGWTQTRVCRLELGGCEQELNPNSKVQLQMRITFKGEEKIKEHNTTGLIFSNVN